MVLFLTHFCIVSVKRDLQTVQALIRCSIDTAKWGIWLRSTLFALKTKISVKIIKNRHPLNVRLTCLIFKDRRINAAVMIQSFRTNRSGQTVDPKGEVWSGLGAVWSGLGAVWSGSTLFAIQSTSFGCITLWWNHICSNFRTITAIFRVSRFLGFLQYITIFPG